MSAMPGHVTRTTRFRLMDQAWQALGPAKFLVDYDTTSEKMDWLLAKAVADGVIPQDVADHVVQHWLDKYWPGAGARAVLQRGLYWAMRVALFEDGDPAKPRGTALPVSCVWICSGSWGGQYQPSVEVDI